MTAKIASALCLDRQAVGQALRVGLDTKLHDLALTLEGVAKPAKSRQT